MKLSDGALLYYEEVRERTELARHAQSKYRRNRVGLPRYTKAELEKLNGPVRTYSLKESENTPCRT